MKLNANGFQNKRDNCFSCPVCLLDQVDFQIKPPIL